uniref:Uncharacterized protein n=1 Tax=Mycena chlorophos TaxID=658473 RepID=A0ABQ0L4L3_MYCCL|nr:predicted protein [Mycena chlorophos]
MLPSEFLPASRPRGVTRERRRGAPPAIDDALAQACLDFEGALSAFICIWTLAYVLIAHVDHPDEHYLKIADFQREIEMKAEAKIQKLEKAQALRGQYIADATSMGNVIQIISHHLPTESLSRRALDTLLSTNHLAIQVATTAQERDEAAMDRHVQKAANARQKLDAAIEVVLSRRIKRREYYDGWEVPDLKRKMEHW